MEITNGLTEVYVSKQSHVESTSEDREPCRLTLRSRGNLNLRNLQTVSQPKKEQSLFKRCQQLSPIKSAILLVSRVLLQKLSMV